MPTIDVAISDFTNTDIGWGVTALPSLISLPSSPSARRVIFNITNINAASTLADTPDIAHTLWVIKSDLPPDNLPTKGPGLGVDISKLDVWGAVPALNSGEKSALHLDLEPGKYVLICNIVPNNVEFPSHYEQGSFTGFTVKEER
ncbi:MAG: hypothetical protein O2821_08305 [Chloroflexi bacterium]|nr:hypothetical protein [Chloroflexota bacterium]